MRAGDQAASFRADDRDCHLVASLSCAACLSSDVAWDLRFPAEDPRAECACRRCGFRRTVFLRAEQALRLSLHERRPLDPTPQADDDYALL